MTEPAVVAVGLTKVYRVYGSPWDRLREAATRRSRHREFRALADVSFEISEGEGLAVIGENGAGKSTLLKILAGITAPTAGSLAVRGKVASILELGSGFHPEFSGRQNVVLNAAMLGLSEEEVRARMPEICEFSELGDFLDQPVKVYSTGMAMRLGFSIAVQVDPDVLIVDEALSVGDGYFQKKCMDRLQRYVERGGTLLFCSHAMYYVSAFCQRALWLRAGQAERLGPVEEVVRDYENYLVAKGAGGQGPAKMQDRAAPALPEPRIDRRARLSGLTVNGIPVGPGIPPVAIQPGAELTIDLAWTTSDPDLAFHAGLGINRADGVEVVAFATHLDDLKPVRGDTEYRLRLSLPHQPLVKGEFTLYAYVLDDRGLYVYDQWVVPTAFRAESSAYRFGLIAAEHSWTAVPAAAQAPEPAISTTREGAFR